MKMSRRRGRPPEGFTRSEDAASLFQELRSRGLTWDEALWAVQHVLGSSKSTVEKYRRPRIAFANDDMAKLNARIVLAKHWDTMIRPRLETLDEKSRCAILDLARETGRTFNRG